MSSIVQTSHAAVKKQSRRKSSKSSLGATSAKSKKKAEAKRKRAEAKTHLAHLDGSFSTPREVNPTSFSHVPHVHVSSEDDDVASELSTQFRRSKVESKMLWQTIVDSSPMRGRGATTDLKFSSNAKAGRNTDKVMKRGQEIYDKGAAADDAAAKGDDNDDDDNDDDGDDDDDDDDDARSEDGEEDFEFQLPAVSVSGYRTSYFMIHPNHPAKIAFDFWIGFLIVGSVLVVPFQIGFRVDESKAIFIAECIVDAFFGLDIFTTFRTAIFAPEQGGYETNPRVIAVEYAKGMLLIDVMSTIPFDLAVKLYSNSGDSNNAMLRSSKLLKALRLVRLLKLIRLLKLTKLFKAQPEKDPGINPTFASLAKMVAMLYFIAHLLGCLWYLILDNGKIENWLNRFGQRDDMEEATTLWERYLISIYWAFTTMTTVGYGDLVGTNRTEYYVVILGMLVGASVFGYVIGNVTAMMENFDQGGSLYNDKMEEIKLYVADRRMPPSLGKKVKEHFKDHYKRKSIFEELREDQISPDLPPSVAISLIYAEHCDLIERLTLLNSNAPTFVASLLPCMKPFSVQAKEIIARENDLGMCLFILETGTAKQYIPITPSLRSIATTKEDKGGHVQEVTAILDLSKPIGFTLKEDERRELLLVASLEPGGQAHLAGVEEGQCVVKISNNEMKKRSDFVLGMEQLQKKNSSASDAVNESLDSSAIPCTIVCQKLEDKFFHFRDLAANESFGEAPVLFGTPHIATTVAEKACSLWHISKEDLIHVLDASSEYRSVRGGLEIAGIRFLENVVRFYEAHDHEGRPESVEDMLADMAADFEGIFGDSAADGDRQKIEPAKLVSDIIFDVRGSQKQMHTAPMIEPALLDVHSKKALTSSSTPKGATLRDDTPDADRMDKQLLSAEHQKDLSESKDEYTREARGLSLDTVPMASSDGSGEGRDGTKDIMSKAPAGGDDQPPHGSEITPALLFASTGLFHPDALQKMVWDVLLSLVILYSVITVTYQVRQQQRDKKGRTKRRGGGV